MAFNIHNPRMNYVIVIHLYFVYHTILIIILYSIFVTTSYLTLGQGSQCKSGPKSPRIRELNIVERSTMKMTFRENDSPSSKLIIESLRALIFESAFIRTSTDLRKVSYLNINFQGSG